MPAPGEIALAGRVAGLLWITAGPLMAGELLIPGIDCSRPEALLALSGVAVLWGIACLFIPFKRFGPTLFLIPAALALLFIALGVGATDGGGSPLFLLLFFVMAYVAYFFPPAVAAGYLVGCAVVQALPLLYDADAVHEGLVGELLIAVPGYAVLGGFIVVCKSQLIRLRDEAQQRALRDPLTGLANRRALMGRLESVGNRRATDVTGLLVLDVDRFRDVNTLYGHPAGDEVLRAVAGAMRSVTREDDFVARLGGDEFAIVASGVTAPAMGRLAQRVVSAVHAADRWVDRPDYRLSASVGWALYPEDAGSVEQLMALADDAERTAKDLGKDRAVAAAVS